MYLSSNEEASKTLQPRIRLWSCGDFVLETQNSVFYIFKTLSLFPTIREVRHAIVSTGYPVFLDLRLSDEFPLLTPEIRKPNGSEVSVLPREPHR